MARQVLVVGGTGPSGVPLVDNFLREDASVTIFHSGRHEAAFDGDVEHLHGDARDQDDIAKLLGGRTWDVAVCTSGRLRLLSETLKGRVERLVGITGQPVYDGAMRPTPEGMLPVPVAEGSPRQSSAADYTGKVAAGEDQLMEQHAQRHFDAVIVRYPGIYGPNSYLAHEWAIVKRIVDGRPRMAMPHGGSTYFQRGFGENVAHLVYLAATQAEACGQTFNAGDEQVVNARHAATLIVDELGGELEFVDVPAQYCRGSYPLAEKSSIVLDLDKARRLLDYRDVVPVDEATRRTARWLAEHQEFGRETDPRFVGSLSYEQEDEILAAWDAVRPTLEAARPQTEKAPGGR